MAIRFPSTPILNQIRTAEMFHPDEEIREHILKDVHLPEIVQDHE
jgi:hypothetical protein